MRRRWLPMRREEGIFSSLDRIHEELDRWFNDVVSTFFGSWDKPSLREWSVTSCSPRIELYDQGKELVLRAELPGIDPKDVDIRVLEDRVIMKGELRRDEEIKDESYYRCERVYGSFARTIPLPVDVKPSESKASYKNGILTLILPKAEPEKEEGFRVEIEKEE
ncbi:MAG: Hsp20/alpha crystallin family protein [Synergistetes bacterium]|nr:Hsp20/alpha crystallin family protein [Synergistota bacterium]MCX8127910.1 Hsp20/alpha crystallin family protein [Synergistota bacterium]MDW8192172.1 Hsp20/alpha crystallin family protein [Synergistota bacterium]